MLLTMSWSDFPSSRLSGALPSVAPLMGVISFGMQIRSPSGLPATRRRRRAVSQPFGARLFRWIFENYGRWVIMEGYHRLARLAVEGLAHGPRALPRSCPASGDSTAALRVTEHVHQLPKRIPHIESPHPPGFVDRAIFDDDFGVLHALECLLEVIDFNR